MFKLILSLLTIHNCLCERSFTVVLDTTKSMKDEIFAIKANIGQVVNTVNKKDFGNFVLVTFKDSVVESPFTTTSDQEFTTRLNSLQPSGGYDCPETSIAGIEAALTASEKQSTIFVFTDAFAKDFNNFRTVKSLCKETHSQVMIFLSGYCEPSQTRQVGNVDVYYDVAKACSGAVFRFDTPFDLRQAFKYVKEIANTDWTNVTPYEKFVDFKQLSFSVDSFTTDLMIVISGTSPSIEVVGTNLQTSRLESIIETRQSLVVRIRQPEVGEYMANIRGQGPIYVTFYEKNNIPFEFGFSTKSPRSLKETSSRPIAGGTNFILINVDNSINLRSIEWLILGESGKQVLYLKQNPSGSYLTSVFVEQGKSFRFWIIGEEISTQHEIKGPSKVITPQMPVNKNNVRHIKPEAEILDSELGLIDFGSALTLACKVVAFPQPDITWQSEESDFFSSETIVLEIPSVFISYVTISNVTKNFTISCHVRNELDMVDKTIDVFVNRTFSFDVIQRPEDSSVEFGSEHFLYCKVDAYPEATIKWYLNDSLIDTYTYSRVSFEDDALVIKEMGFEDIGAYECRASNGVESKSFKAAIEITGVESPEINDEIYDIKMNLKPGDQAEIKCRISQGKPAPDITWTYKVLDGSDYKMLPSGVSTEDEKLVIKSVQKNHGGVYRCTASNAIGEDTKDFTVTIQYPPVIKSSELETIVVKEGDQVHLFCEVEAIPGTTVRWEMSQGDVFVTFDHRHRTDESHTHHFLALWNDAGNYHCIAENNVGKAERTVILNVLVSPFIETPRSKYVYSSIEDSVTLPCNVLYGNPAPNILWEFIPKDSYSRSIRRDNSASALHLTKVSQNDQGTYMCIAENLIGTDRIKYHLVVQ